MYSFSHPIHTSTILKKLVIPLAFDRAIEVASFRRDWRQLETLVTYAHLRCWATGVWADESGTQCFFNQTPARVLSIGRRWTRVEDPEGNAYYVEPEDNVYRNNSSDPTYILTAD